MVKYGLHGHFKAKPGESSQLAAILMRAAQLMQHAKGCHLYAVAMDEQQPHSVWVTEIWDSKEDHDNSLSAPGVGELIAEAMPLLDGMPQKGQELKILGGLGVDA